MYRGSHCWIGQYIMLIYCDKNFRFHGISFELELKEKNCLSVKQMWSFSVNRSSMLSILSWNYKEKNCLLVDWMWSFLRESEFHGINFELELQRKECLLVSRMWSFNVNPSYMNQFWVRIKRKELFYWWTKCEVLASIEVPCDQFWAGTTKKLFIGEPNVEFFAWIQVEIWGVKNSLF